MSNFLREKGLKDLKPDNINNQYFNNDNSRYYAGKNDGQEELEDMEQEVGYEPIFALPYLDVDKEPSRWPGRLRKLYMMADTGPLQDAVFLTSLSLLPFTIAPKLRVRYNRIDLYCTPMLLFAAPPAAVGRQIARKRLFHATPILSYSSGSQMENTVFGYL